MHCMWCKNMRDGVAEDEDEEGVHRTSSVRHVKDEVVEEQEQQHA